MNDRMMTVVMATKNRDWLLREVLESYCRLQIPEGGWKLIVADNGSTDNTEGVIDSFKDRIPVQRVFESTPGKNAALNRTLPLIEGDLAVFTDDDAFVHEDWLIELRKGADTHPDISIFGGAVLPRWEIEPPVWTNWIDCAPVYAITDSTLREGECNPLLIFGPNMAVRSLIFQSGVKFDVRIGPRGENYPMGSETELVLRLVRQGYKTGHVPKAVVEHFIRKEQLDKRWVLQRGIRYGRGSLRLGPPLKRWLGIPRHLYRDIPKQLIVVLVAFATFRKKAGFAARWRLNYLKGLAIESRHMGHEHAVEQSTATRPRSME